MLVFHPEKSKLVSYLWKHRLGFLTLTLISLTTAMINICEQHCVMWDGCDVFCRPAPTGTCLRAVVLSNFHFVPSV